MNRTIDGQGIVTLPGSKSIAIRALICSTFLKSTLRIINFPACRDCLTLLDAIQVLGFYPSATPEGLIINPSQKRRHHNELYIIDSAAAFRFLIFRLAGWKDLNTEIRLSSQLAGRPHEPLIEIIRALCGCIERDGDRFFIHGTRSLQFTREAQNLLNRHSTLTSQFISGLLLSAPLFKEGLSIEISPAQVSSTYLHLTLDVMDSFGIKHEWKGRKLSILTDSYQNPRTFKIEEDFSSACYFWTIGALSNRPVGVKTSIKSSKQADFGFLQILMKMGAIVKVSEAEITVQGNELQGIDVDMGKMPDQVPTLAVLALFADSPTTISNVKHLRYKETDRIAALITELTRIGADAGYKEGILIIKPLKTDPPEVTLHTCHDHRLVMSFFILTLIFKQIRIDSPVAVSKSFPDFFSKLRFVTKNS